MADVISIHTDGASRGNPGPAAFAYTIEAPGMDEVAEAATLGTMTNNQAEYTALVRALEHAARLGLPLPVVVHSDSELMVKQVRGEYRVKNEDLRPLFEEARRLIAQIPGGVTLRHVPREQNSRADELCNQVLDGERPSSPQHEPWARKRPLSAEAVEVLREAGARSPVEAWASLARLLERHGVRLP
jgi:ribonuclease HI